MIKLLNITLGYIEIWEHYTMFSSIQLCIEQNNIDENIDDENLSQ